MLWSIGVQPGFRSFFNRSVLSNCLLLNTLVYLNMHIYLSLFPTPQNILKFWYQKASNIPMHIHDYSISPLHKKSIGKDHPVGNPIKLTHVLYYEKNEWPLLNSAVWFEIGLDKLCKISTKMMLFSNAQA